MKSEGVLLPPQNLSIFACIAKDIMLTCPLGGAASHPCLAAHA